MVHLPNLNNPTRIEDSASGSCFHLKQYGIYSGTIGVGVAGKIPISVQSLDATKAGSSSLDC